MPFAKEKLVLPSHGLRQSDRRHGQNRMRNDRHRHKMQRLTNKKANIFVGFKKNV